MNKHYVRMTALAAVVVLSACTTINQKVAHYMTAQDMHYLSAQNMPPLQIPAHLNSSNVRDDYPIPSLPNRGPVGALPSLVPPGSPSQQLAASASVATKQATANGVTLTRHNGQPVLYVPGTVNSVFAQTLPVLQKMGVENIRPEAKVDGYWVVLGSKPTLYELMLEQTGQYTMLSLQNGYGQPSFPEVSEPFFKQMAAVW